MELGSLTLKLKAQVGNFLRDTEKAKRSVEDTARSVSSAEARFRAFGQQSTAVRDVVREVENLRRSSQQLNAVLNSKASGQFSPQVLAALRKRAADVDGQLASLTGTAQKGSSAFSRLGAMLNPTALGIGVAIAGFYALGRAIIGSVEAFTQFERGMTRVGAVTDTLGTKAFQDLQNTAIDLAATTEFTSRQVADAMGFMGMAGFKANEIMAATPAVLQLASAGMLDVARAADITTNIMSGYGLEIGELERANNVLVATFTNSNTTLEMLGQSFKYVGPVARAAGVEFEELSAALGLLGNAGIQADTAGRAIRQGIARLLAPTRMAGRIIKDLGLEVKNADGSLKSLREILDQLAKSGAETGHIMRLFGVEAGPSWQALLDQGSGALDELRNKILEAGDIAKRIADAQLNTFDGQIKIMRSNVEAAAIAFAEELVPTLRELVPLVTDIATGLFSLARDALPWVTEGLKGFRDLLILITGNGNRVNAFLRILIRYVKAFTEHLDRRMGPLDDWILKLGKLVGLDVAGWLKGLEKMVADVGVSFGKTDQSLQTNAQNFKLFKTTAEATGRVLRKVSDDVGVSTENTTKKIARQRAALQDMLRTLRAANNKSGSSSPVQAAMAEHENALLDVFAKVAAQTKLGLDEQLDAVAAASDILEDTLRNKLIKALVDASDDLGKLAKTTGEVREQIAKSDVNIDADQIIAHARELSGTLTLMSPLDSSNVLGMPAQRLKGISDADRQNYLDKAKEREAAREFAREAAKRSQESTANALSTLASGDVARIASALGTAIGGPVGAVAGAIIGDAVAGVLSSIVEGVRAVFQQLAGPEFSGLVETALGVYIGSVVAAAGAMIGLVAVVGAVAGTIVSGGTLGAIMAVAGALSVLLGAVIAAIGVIVTLVSALGYLVSQTDVMANVQESMSLLFGKLIAVMEPFAEVMLVNSGVAEFLFNALKQLAIILGQVALMLMEWNLIEATEKQMAEARDALKELRDYTFEAAYAEAKLNDEREKGARRLREFNEELKNVPDIFKIAAVRAGVDTGESRGGASRWRNADSSLIFSGSLPTLNTFPTMPIRLGNRWSNMNLG